MSSKNIDNKEIKETINLTKKHIIIVIITVLLITIAGTFAWLSWKSNDTALVLTVGDINSAQVILKPYQINSTITPVLTYENEEYTEVTATNNNTSDKMIRLFYKINNIDPELVSTDFKYTITKSTDNGKTYTEYLSGDFSTVSTDTGFYIMQERLSKTKTYKYKVYIWLLSSDENQTDIQGKSFTGELRATIEEAEPTGADMLIKKANPSTLTYANATDSQKGEMWTFVHDATEQVKATTDYRYIGDRYCSYESGQYGSWVNSDDTCPKRYNYVRTTISDSTTKNYTNQTSCPEDDSTYTYECAELTNDGIVGVKPKNYITFNNELWRIIGVFDGRIKIIRREPLGNMSWDYKLSGVGSSTGNGSNDWTDSQLMYMLNPTSYTLKTGYSLTDSKIYDGSSNIIYQLGCRPASIASSSTSYSCTSNTWSLNSTALSQISEATYYLGGLSGNSGYSASSYYAFERGTKVYSGRPTSWTGLVGLMYPSDYAYTFANGVNEACYTDAYNCDNDHVGAIKRSSWLYESIIQWTISPYYGDANNVFFVEGTGNVKNYGSYHDNGIRPVVYLKSDIKLQGSGTSSDPYKIIKETPIITTMDLVNKANASTLTYADATNSQKGEMWTFVHDATEQVEVTTDYRYIGNRYCSYESGQYGSLINSDGTCPKRYNYVRTTISDGTTASYINKSSCPSNDSTYTYECTELTNDGVVGVEPKNYITYNNEEWRIIGVFDGRIKIIRNDSLGKLPLDYKQTGVGSATSSNGGSNDWTDSQTMYMLNPTSYTLKDGYSLIDNKIYDGSNNIIYQLGCQPASIASGASSYDCTSNTWSLNSTALSQISEATYYLGGSSTNSGHSASSYYAFERGTTVYSGRPTSWTGLVGLMYPSDYAYTFANGVNDICYSNTYNCDNDDIGAIKRSSWLYSSDVSRWTISPRSNDSNDFFNLKSGGSMSNSSSYSSYYDITPVVYLRSNIKLTGSGTSDDPYRIIS